MARGVTNNLPGIGAGRASAAAQSARGNELIKNLAVGGLALGGGAGVAVALVNYLRSLSQENELNDEDRLDDDTLYIPAQKKSASEPGVNRWLAPGLALTGSVLTAGASYAATQAIYNYLQKKHRQRLLDEAQLETLEAAGIETEKAAAQMTFADLATAFPVAIPLLAAMASGGVAYAALNKAFPVVQPPKSKYPKRIRAIAADGGVEELSDDVEADTLKKSAAEADIEAAANEFLTLFTDRLAMEKKAMCMTSDILNRVAKDGTAELTKVYKEQGLSALCECVKGASLRPASVSQKAAAAILLQKSARLAPALNALAAAEFIDMMPIVSAHVQSMGSEGIDKMAGLASLLHLSLFRPQAAECVEKSAAEGNAMLMELIQKLSEARTQDGAASNQEIEERDAALTSDLSGSMSEDNEGEASEKDEDHDIETTGKNDVVDDFMDDPQVAEKFPAR